MKRKLVAILALCVVLCGALFALCACDIIDSEEETFFWTYETAYAEAQELGFDGTLEDFIIKISGKNGDKGDKGEKGEKGNSGSDGVGIKNIHINVKGNLIIQLTDNSEVDCGSVVKEHVHVESEWIINEPATETERGLKHKECIDCGAYLDVAFIPATGVTQPEHKHAYTQVICNENLASPTTCTKSAKYYYSCTCGKKDVETFEYGQALGHSFINYIYDENAKCEEDGTETAVCDRENCFEEHTRTKENTALNHVWSEWESNNNDMHTRICSRDNKHVQRNYCNGGTATCLEKATCVDCHASYGNFARHDLDENNICSVCKKEGVITLILKLEYTIYEGSKYENFVTSKFEDEEKVLALGFEKVDDVTYVLKNVVEGEVLPKLSNPTPLDTDNYYFSNWKYRNGTKKVSVSLGSTINVENFPTLNESNEIILYAGVGTYWTPGYV